MKFSEKRRNLRIQKTSVTMKARNYEAWDNTKKKQ